MNWWNKPKYGNKKLTTTDGKFDSKLEYYRWCELVILEKSKKISDLKRQVKFVLIPAQREPDIIGKRGGIKKGKLIEQECSYYADFTYIDKNGNFVVEDAKGYKGGDAYALFVVKRKLMLYVHKIKVKEV